ncbi:hypothetical protein SAMN04490248_102189 [Salinihabitans flavidus]|uniref:Cyclopropane-fatty-acyl-phospholipid synthase n=1 Tax=Salinihabitans flavidus TaxID=569882 RepID=A0A1H8MPN5_9RHOB|nr:DUF1365 domain-containing protein [Salinihabitans flavidus]SEO19194.1 hypothetical protein SAMN04490248_102189 [Salinihabitans flavidus]
MTAGAEHIRGRTWHGRRGAIANAFSYGVDFVLLEPEAPRLPALLSHNRFNLWAVHDRHHGGARGAGEGAAWVRRQLAAHGHPDPEEARIELLTQPSFLGLHFNPVSFWLIWHAGALNAVIAEVNNTMGDRHSYFCARPGFAPIRPRDEITATKIFHVSPFQDTRGTYRFHFRVTDRRIAIRIALEDGAGGVLATLNGARRPATPRSLLGAALRRPMGSGRVVALILWQALKLWAKGARFRRRPAPPAEEISS